MPIEAAIEHRMQIARRARVAGRVQNMIELVGKFLGDMAKRDGGKTLGKCGGKSCA